MKLGAFLVPSRPPERSRSDNRCWELEELVRLEELGLDEAWIGEQIATSWGTCDLPELIIARSLFETNRIRLGTLGYLLPHNNPIEMANRIAYLDHVSNGRIQLGIGVRSLPADNIIAEAEVGRSSRLSFELIETMVDLWQTEAPKIEYGRGSMEATGISLPWLGRDCKPLQQPHPPIAIAAITPSSRNLRFAGEKGYIPISLSVDPDGSCTALHWRTVQKGAERSGLSPDPEAWRIVRDIYVAPTDAEARDCAVNGIMGRCWREFILPAYLE
ncbi:LLM class flavin-dependent oxidoreductase, partial [Aliiruegeria sabulilitoris]|uniref:LLM class flavin-dependent oxidoreductase n=1 Tax=Aliiruegeria sabulilitoris TaxID=1510458 RepID=UPI0009E6EBE7